MNETQTLIVPTAEPQPSGAWTADLHLRLEVRAPRDASNPVATANAVVGALGQILGSGSRPALPPTTTPDITFAEFLPTLAEYFGVYHAETTVRGERGRLDRIVRHFGSMALRSVRAADIQDFLMRLRAERHVCAGQKVLRNPPASAATRNRYASTLSAAFRLAIERGYVEANPVQRVRRQRESKSPVPFISSADVDRLLSHVEDRRFHALLRVLADTGLRRSEALRLEGRDVDCERRVVTVRRSKSGRPRIVPLTAAAGTALSEVRVGDESAPLWPEFVGVHMGAVEARFRRLRNRAGFSSLRLHDLRHAFCSRLAQAGVPLPTIAALAGHESVATTMRYASHIPDGAAREAIGRLEAAGVQA
jgi:integrase